MRRVRCWDNGGATADRYTVVWLKPYKHRGITYYVVASMSPNPTHPLGVWGVTDNIRSKPEKEIPEFGKRIRFKDLPEICQKLVSTYFD